MTKSKEFIDVVILGAGPPSIGEIPTPLKQISTRNSVIEWQLNCFKELKKIRDIYFVGGYKINEIKKGFPELKIIHNKNWKNDSILDSLFKFPRKNSNVLVTYSDTLFRKEFIKKLIKSEEEVTIAIDSLWRNRYLNRTDYDINIAEKIKLKNSLDNKNEVEFTGLVKINKNALEKIF